MSEHWLAQFLALRDISHFVVGASIQRFVQEGSLDAELQASCTETRNAVFVSLDGFRIPQKFSKLEMIETFSEIFRAILPDTLSASIEDASRVIFDEEATDAIDAFSLSLHERQVVHRVSDVHMMGAMSSIKENVASFVDGGPRSRIPFQRAYALNCSSCHFVGHHKFTEANNLTIPVCILPSVCRLTCTIINIINRIRWKAR